MYPLFVLGLLFLAGFAIQVMRVQDPIDQRFAQFIVPFAWLVFVIDYGIQLVLAPHKWHYIRTHPLMLLALLFPPFRIFLVFHVFTVISRNAPIGNRSRTYLLFITTLTAFVGAILVVYFERQSPTANINSFGNALWWVGETVSTVGYGDYYPVTVGGRIVAVMLFVNGVAVVSVITAGLAQSYTTSEQKRQNSGLSASSQHASEATGTPTPTPTSSTHTAFTGSDGADPPPSEDHVLVPKAMIDGLQQRLANMEADLRTLTAHIGGRLSGPDSHEDTPPT